MEKTLNYLPLLLVTFSFFLGGDKSSESDSSLDSQSGPHSDSSEEEVSSQLLGKDAIP